LPISPHPRWPSRTREISAVQNPLTFPPNCGIERTWTEVLALTFDGNKRYHVSRN